jgi:hypothetical protein
LLFWLENLLEVEDILKPDICSKLKIFSPKVSWGPVLLNLHKGGSVKGDSYSSTLKELFFLFHWVLVFNQSIKAK